MRRTYSSWLMQDGMSVLLSLSSSSYHGGLAILRVIMKAAKRKISLTHLATDGARNFDTNEHATNTEEEPNSLLPEEVPRSHTRKDELMRTTTQKRRYSIDLPAEAMDDTGTRAISGHATPAMQSHYSTVASNEVEAGLAKVVSLAGIRDALGEHVRGGVGGKLGGNAVATVASGHDDALDEVGGTHVRPAHHRASRGVGGKVGGKTPPTKEAVPG